jgi:hypothetical protein
MEIQISYSKLRNLSPTDTGSLKLLCCLVVCSLKQIRLGSDRIHFHFVYPLRPPKKKTTSTLVKIVILHQSRQVNKNTII